MKSPRKIGKLLFIHFLISLFAIVFIFEPTWAKTITNYLTHYPIDWDTPVAWDYSIDAKTVQQWVLLGDPSLKIGGYPK